MENNNTFITMMLIWMFVFMFIAGAKINNKLYDIREHMNGTCVLENTYNGTCKENK